MEFEEALMRLEEIVRRLEQEGLGLDEALRLFEEGMKLRNICEERLNEAKDKIEILVKDEDSGEITKRPFNLNETVR
ncbi:MAG: exodeoxyribonuclease VII small subunit [bacterium]|nr:exodeoxyribonuclease VII small subunit [bacterium]